jgi:hypothetical protein
MARSHSPVAASGDAATAVRSSAHRPSPKPAAPAERPPLLIVAPRFRRRRAGVVAAFVMLSLFGVMIGLVAFQTRLAQGQGKLDRLEREAREEQLRYDKLRGDVAVLESPAHIVSAALAQGMVSPGDIKYVTTPPEAVAAVAAASGQGAPPPDSPNAGAGADAGGDAGVGTAEQPPAPGTPATVDQWSTVKPIVSGAP